MTDASLTIEITLTSPVYMLSAPILAEEDTKGSSMTDVAPKVPVPAAADDDDVVFDKLKRLHLYAAIFMGIQGLAYSIVCGSKDAITQPTVSFQGDCSGPDAGDLACNIQIQSVGDLDALPLMPVFVWLAAIDHAITYYFAHSDPTWTRGWLFVTKSNPLRWAEYSISASCMALALTMLCRITDIHIWFCVFFMTGVGMLTGLVLEMLPQPNTAAEAAWNATAGAFKAGTIRVVTFIIGSLSIFLPWLILMCYFFRSASQPDSEMPDFVYAA